MRDDQNVCGKVLSFFTLSKIDQEGVYHDVPDLIRKSTEGQVMIPAIFWRNDDVIFISTSNLNIRCVFLEQVLQLVNNSVLP